MALRVEVLEKLSSFITAAFALVAALAWNSAIQQLFAQQPYLQNRGPWVYAFVVTFIAILITIWFGRMVERVKTLDERIKQIKEKLKGKLPYWKRKELQEEKKELEEKKEELEETK